MNHLNYGVPEVWTKPKHIMIGAHTQRSYLRKPKPLLFIARVDETETEVEFVVSCSSRQIFLISEMS